MCLGRRKQAWHKQYNEPAPDAQRTRGFRGVRLGFSHRKLYEHKERLTRYASGMFCEEGKIQEGAGKKTIKSCAHPKNATSIPTKVTNTQKPKTHQYHQPQEAICPSKTRVTICISPRNEDSTRSISEDIATPRLISRKTSQSARACPSVPSSFSQSVDDTLRVEAHNPIRHRIDIDTFFASSSVSFSENLDDKTPKRNDTPCLGYPMPRPKVKSPTTSISISRRKTEVIKGGCNLKQGCLNGKGRLGGSRPFRLVTERRRGLVQLLFSRASPFFLLFVIDLRRKPSHGANP